MYGSDMFSQFPIEGPRSSVVQPFSHTHTRSRNVLTAPNYPLVLAITLVMSWSTLWLIYVTRNYNKKNLATCQIYCESLAKSDESARTKSSK